jgi:sensor histidine kinase YesM
MKRGVNKKWVKYAFRIGVILILDSLIRGFDQSYNGVFSFSARSVFFFFSFFVYWMTGWTILTWTTERLDILLRKKLKTVQLFVTLSGIILLFSAGIAILFNLFYRYYDVRLFGMKEIWADVPFPHPELIYPLILVTILLSAFDLYTKYSARLENMELYASNLEQDNIRAKYQALKNQIDPHFFFNSLSVLSSIIQTNPDMSIKYVHNLSKLYRYILETKQNIVVPLTDELNFLDSYIFLLKIRYPYSLNFRIDLDRSKSDRMGIHPNSLQLLIENAIKHNVFKDEEPLVIEIFEDDEYICVRNPVRKKKQPALSTGIGLENIRRRYELYDKKKIVVQEADGYFIVKLPGIEISK